MNNLLEFAVAAHGGYDNWKKLSTLKAHASIGGGLWALKGHADALDDVRIELDLRSQHVDYSPFGGPGRHGIYEPDRTAVQTDTDQVIESREHPRAAFAGHAAQTPWDSLHLAYFSGYAIWTYLTTPFLFKLPGFESEEIEPWTEDGESWRRLRVRFPATVPSHSTEQVFYFDETGILRRHDYSADLLGGLPSANYAYEPKTFGGIVFPTKRRAFSRRPDNTPDRNRIAVSIDIQHIEV